MIGERRRQRGERLLIQLTGLVGSHGADDGASQFPIGVEITLRQIDSHGLGRRPPRLLVSVERGQRAGMRSEAPREGGQEGVGAGCGTAALWCRWPSGLPPAPPRGGRGSRGPD
jgi:hypothetical protein